MNAWPMIAQCLERQWWGYTAAERGGIAYAWDHMQSSPGLVGSLACTRLYPLWAVRTPTTGQQELICLKEDDVL